MKGINHPMRLRNIKGSRDVIAVSPYVIREEESRAGAWSEIFGNPNPIHLEIGMGKGKFIMSMAKKNPQINYVGIEKYSSVLLRALEKMAQEEHPPANLFFVRMDAENITRIFGRKEAYRIYLNFSDPWPKDRHAKRRLTSPEFLARYKQILDPAGRIEFKTDNRSLFDFSLESIQESGWKLHRQTYDLHSEESLMQENIMTEYEERFSAMGNPIHMLIAGP